MEVEVAVLSILAARHKEVLKVSILRLSIRLGLLIYTITDPIILSDNESVDAESDTDYSSLDIDATAQRDCDSRVADSELTDSGGFGSGTTPISDRPVTDHQNDDDD